MISSSDSLWNIPCSQIIANQQVITIDSEDSIESACQTLIKNGISSAPVFEKKTSNYVGMFDYRDIVDYVLIVFKRKDMTNLSSTGNNDDIDIQEIIKLVRSGKSITAKNASDLSQKNDFCAIPPEATVSAALDILSDKNIHRVNVMDMASGKVIGILSQSDIIKYIGKNLDALDDFTNKSIKDLGLAKFKPVSIDSESTVMNALSMMSEIGISSIAVVDVAGKIVGSISMTDIKGLENEGRDRVPVLDVHQESRLDFAVKKILATRVHRLWVVDDDQVLVGIISLTDILNYFKSKLM